jgi:hypothetical protein
MVLLHKMSPRQSLEQTHKSEQHQKGIGKDKNNKDKEDIDETANMATYDAGFGADF